MKRRWIVILISIMLVSMSGCVETIELDDEQEAKFIGYSVYAVLEHDNNYMIGLNNVPIEESTEDSSEGVDEPQTPDNGNSSGESNNGSNNGGSNGSSAEMVSMNKALGIDGISVIYTDLVVCDSFPEYDGTPAFMIKAFEGNKFVVLKFNITNTTGSDMQLDLSPEKLSFKGIFNNTVKIDSRRTLLPEAMNTYDGTIKAGETIETVLVYEMSEGYTSSLTNIVLEIKSESGTSSVRIK